MKSQKNLFKRNILYVNKCFICGARLDRMKKWPEDYCFKHENIRHMSVKSASKNFGHRRLMYPQKGKIYDSCCW